MRILTVELQEEKEEEEWDDGGRLQAGQKRGLENIEAEPPKKMKMVEHKVKTTSICTNNKLTLHCSALSAPSSVTTTRSWPRTRPPATAGGRR